MKTARPISVPCPIGGTMMMSVIIIAMVMASIAPISAMTQDIPEPQGSLARELRPVAYYVRQAELWSAELQRDSLSEENWYNYYRSCRNAHGMADWRSDLVKEYPVLKDCGEIIELMERYIPGTVTYNYLLYLTHGVGSEYHDHLMKAYAIDPKFKDIQSSVISYAECSLNAELRRTVNKAWYETNYLSHQLLTYNYNVLMSLDSNAILLTQADNDTYPTWMLQDVFGIRTDVTVINIDFLLIDAYRDSMMRSLQMPPLDVGEPDPNEEHADSRKVVEHILRHATGDRPVYLGVTVMDQLYVNFKDYLHVSGLALRLGPRNLDLTERNVQLVRNIFHLDYLEHPFTFDRDQRHVDYQNINYIGCFKLVYDHHRLTNDVEFATRVRRLAEGIAARIPGDELRTQVRALFR